MIMARRIAVALCILGTLFSACSSEESTPDSTTILGGHGGETTDAGPLDVLPSPADAGTDTKHIGHLPPIVEGGTYDGPHEVMCPGECLVNVMWEMDCYQHEFDCIQEFRPSFTQLCVVDKKYCSWGSWADWCVQQRSVCNAACTIACNNCSNSNGCHLQSYECSETCAKDIVH